VLIRKALLLFSCFILLVLTSCKVNYSFTGASIAPDLKTFSVLTFPNYAPLIQPTLSQSFTEALKDKFQAQTNLQLISRGGDLHFEGSITGYAVAPIAIQSGTDIAAQTRLTITVNVKFTNSKNDKQNFETSFSRFADYESSKSLSVEEDRLIKEINEQLVQDIFNKAVVNW
jgi:Lipopolysaccharide-assembly